ncbi:MAG: DUF6456 domain-containing protein [Xanthobacteraceae bacterium]
MGTQQEFEPELISLDSLAEDSVLYDPTNDIHTALDDTGEIAIEPMRYIARLHQDGSINAVERDAAEIMHRMFSIGSTPLRDLAFYDWRDAAGKWTRRQEARSVILAKVDATIEGVRSLHRRRAVRHALACASPIADIGDPSALAAGIEDVARLWWGVHKRNTVVINGITMPRVTPAEARVAAAVNDNDEPGVKRIVEGFDRMHARGQLDAEPLINRALYTAGCRYQQDHHAAGLSPLGAMDYSRVFVDGGEGGGGLFGSENATRALQRFRSARVRMGDRFGPAVDAVVIEGKTLEDAGISLTKYKSAKQAAAVAQDRLDVGLRLLAVHYGTLVHRQAA